MPAALVYDHLDKRGMASGVAFLGHSRHDIGEANYKPGTVYATEADIKALKRDPKERILVVDDAVETESTLRSVVKFMGGLGIRRFDFLCMRKPSSLWAPAYNGPTLIRVKERKSQ
jgi:adenine/guanine phosphoribosyltransferase-like PRPP-binding protein